MLHPPVMIVLVLRLGVKESRVQAGPRVDADGFVCPLVGEGHRFGGAGVSNAHCAREAGERWKREEKGGNRESARGAGQQKKSLEVQNKE